MTLDIGIIGAGAMGTDHAHNLTGFVPDARVAAIYDFDAERSKSLAGEVGADSVPTAQDVIESSDAVIITSPDNTHPDFAKACFAAGRFVLCEKPLALTAGEARAVVDAEIASGAQRLQIGFNRRYDPPLRALRALIADGELGDVQVLHCVHRNAQGHPSYGSSDIVTGSMIHEFDMVRWLLDDDIAAVRIVSPVPPESGALRDPQLATFEMAGGALVTVEVFVNAAYGYEVLVEAVGSRGVGNAVPPSPNAVVRRDFGRRTAIAPQFPERFADSYREELRAWVAASRDGRVDGPSAWDGFLASLSAEAGVAALTSGDRVVVTSPDRPDFYSR